MLKVDEKRSASGVAWVAPCEVPIPTCRAPEVRLSSQSEEADHK